MLVIELGVHLFGSDGWVIRNGILAQSFHLDRKALI